MTREVLREMTVGQVIAALGEEAGEIIDKHLCESEKICCLRVTHTLEYVATIRGRKDKLPLVLDKLLTLIPVTT